LREIKGEEKKKKREEKGVRDAKHPTTKQSRDQKSLRPDIFSHFQGKGKREEK